MRYANWFITTVSGASIALSAADGLAQVTSPRRETRRVQVVDANANATFRSSQLIGTNITDANGRAIGKIVDFVSDARGNIQFPIISYSGSSDFAGKLFAIPYSGLNFASGPNNTTTAQFSFDPALLQNAPSFTSSEFPNFSDPAYLNELKAFYKDVLDRRIAKDPTVPSNGPGDRPQSQDQAGTPTQPIDPTLPANGPGDRPATVNPALPATETDSATAPTDPRIPGTTGTENAGFPPTANTTRGANGVSGETGSVAGTAVPGGTVDGSTGQSTSSLSTAAHLAAQAETNGGLAANRMMLRGSKMVGMSIQDNKGQSIGKVVDYVGDNFGNNQYAVVSLGTDGRNIVVPFRALHFQSGAKGANFATLGIAPGQLKNAPSFSGNEWPNFADSQVTNGWAKFYERFDYHNGIYPVNAASPKNSATPANPKAGPVGSGAEVPRSGGAGPRIPAPGRGAPGVPGMPPLPPRATPGRPRPGVPAPGGAPGGAPGVPGGGGAKGGAPGAPGGAPGGGAPGGGAGGARGK